MAKFEKGNSAGPGRPKGCENKITRKAKEAYETIMDLLEKEWKTKKM